MIRNENGALVLAASKDFDRVKSNGALCYFHETSNCKALGLHRFKFRIQCQIISFYFLKGCQKLVLDPQCLEDN